MKVHKVELNKVFDSTEQLQAPLYQRPYVWVREQNWDPLWEAIAFLAEARAAGTPAQPHFLGTIVLEQLKNEIGRVPVRQIIDGQQRLTTLQLALTAARDLCSDLGQKDFAGAFRKLTVNDVPLSKIKEDRYKVWPTNADRADFCDVVSAGSRVLVQGHAHADPDDEFLIPDAYLYFAEQIESWLGPPLDAGFTKRLQALYIVLTQDLHLVVIELEGADDAQEIFETLNALGTPLTPADLVKNHLFHIAQAQGGNVDELYDAHWRAFDAEQGYWRKEVKQGRLKRPRLDLFLAHYLTLMRGEEALTAHLFQAFKGFVKSSGFSPAEHMDRFRAYAVAYRAFEELPVSTRSGTFAYRLSELDTSALHPLILEVFKRYGAAPVFEQFAEDIESYVVRRVVCGLETKSYTRAVVAWIKKLREASDFSPDAVRALMLAEEADATRWPGNEEFEESWMSLRFYKKIKRRTRMILEAIEESLYNPKSEKVTVEHGTLTIEHLMPVEWEKHWPLELDDLSAKQAKELERAREDVIHRIGNLTLLTTSLNPSASNGAWPKKQAAIMKHSVLKLNKAIIDAETWDEEAIDRRSKQLFDVAVKIWRRP